MGALDLSGAEWQTLVVCVDVAESILISAEVSGKSSSTLRTLSGEAVEPLDDVGNIARVDEDQHICDPFGAHTRLDTKRIRDFEDVRLQVWPVEQECEPAELLTEALPQAISVALDAANGARIDAHEEDK